MHHILESVHFQGYGTYAGIDYFAHIRPQKVSTFRVIVKVQMESDE